MLAQSAGSCDGDARSRFASAAATAWRSVSGIMGFRTKSVAPSFIASTASSIVRVGRDHDDARVGPQKLHSAEDFQAVHAGHPLVEQRGVEAAAVTKQLQRFIAVSRLRTTVVARGLERQTASCAAGALRRPRQESASSPRAAAPSGGHWQCECERRALSEFRSHGDLAAVRLHDAARDRQARALRRQQARREPAQRARTPERDSHEEFRGRCPARKS